MEWNGAVTPFIDSLVLMCSVFNLFNVHFLQGYIAYILMGQIELGELDGWKVEGSLRLRCTLSI